MWVIHCCLGNQLIGGGGGGCLAKNMIKKANFSNFFLIQLEHAER